MSDGSTGRFLDGGLPLGVIDELILALSTGAGVNYFAYGSNMDLSRLRERAVHPRERRAAVLGVIVSASTSDPMLPPAKEGPTSWRGPTESVEGVLSEVTEEEMGKLDRCEGVPAHYLRASVGRGEEW